MSNFSRKQRRSMQRAFTSTDTGKQGADALMKIVSEEIKTEKIIAVRQKKIEMDTIMAFTTMVMWVLHNDFGFGNREGKDKSGQPTQGKLLRFYKRMAHLADCMNYKKAGVTIEDMQQALKDQCGIDLCGMNELPAVLGGPVYGQSKIQ